MMVSFIRIRSEAGYIFGVCTPKCKMQTGHWYHIKILTVSINSKVKRKSQTNS